MKLSIIMPVYNEVKTVLDVIKKIEDLDLGNIGKELIIVDDGSTDGTKDILKDIKNHKVLFNDENQGMGSAVRTGLMHATGDIVIKQDADLEYEPESFISLIDHMQKNNLPAVYGSRFLASKHKEIPLHYFGNKALTVFTNLLYGSKLTDMETCYKLVRLDVLKSLNLKAKHFDLEPEITSKLLKKGHNIAEIPIRYNARKFEEGKKITWVDGIKAAYYLLKYRFSD